MKNYLISVSAILLTAILMILALSNDAEAVTEHLNTKYMQPFKERATGVSSPWYDDGFHIVDGRFIQELERIERDAGKKRVISIGSSVSAINFNDEAAADPDISYRFLTCGNGSYRSDEILYDLLKAENTLTEGDIVKLEVSFSTFRDTDLTITETMLDKWGAYSVVRADEGEAAGDFYIKKKNALLNPVYALNKALIRIQSVWQLAADAIGQLRHGSSGEGLTARAEEFGYHPNGAYDAKIIPGNFRNNYYNPEAVADTLSISGENERKTEDLIRKLKGDHKLIVEICPTPPGLLTTEFGKTYVSYLDEGLIPFLKAEGIDYLDYRNDFEKDDYADGVHLGYEAGVRYTTRLMEDLNGY